MRLLVKRCVLLSVSQSRALVASVPDGNAVEEIAVDGIAAEEIAVDGIVVGAGVRLAARVRVRLLVDVSLVDGIRGWIRCGSGLRRVVLGRVRRTMKLWI